MDRVKVREESAPKTMATSACPICSRHLRPENLAMHVELCLSKAAGGAAPAAAAAPPFSAFLAPKKRASPARFGIKTRPGAAPIASPPNGASTPPGTEERDAGGDFTSGSASKKRKRNDEPSGVPLAERMRPTSLTDLVGQDEVVGPGKALSRLIDADRVHNMILWGCARSLALR